jgi:sugar phosphate isomerase/epimerase
MMPFGICHSVTLPGTWDTAIAQAAGLGADGIELFVSAADVASFLDAADGAAPVRAAATNAGMPVRSLCLTFLPRGDVKLTDPSESTRQRAIALTAAAIRRCAELGGAVILIPGTPAPENAAEVDRFVDSVRALVPVAKPLGIAIGVEDGYATAEKLALLDRIGSPEVVGDYLDIGNLQGRGIDPAKAIRERIGRITQIHIKGVQAAALDAGTVDLATCAAALRDTRYDGWLVLETRDTEDPIGGARTNMASMRRAFGG